MSPLSVRVLVVEDDPGDADMALERLSADPQARFEVVHHSSLGAAIDWLNNHACDVALLDLNLPDSSGVSTLRRLREELPALPTVVCTSHVDQALRAEALGLGAHEVVAKNDMSSTPFSVVLLSALERGRGRAQQQQLVKILDTMPGAVVVVDVQGQVQYVNSQALTFFGRERHELAQERLFFAAAPGVPVELRVPSKDGERVGEMQVIELTWEGERAFLASIRDLTLQRNLELQLLMADRMASLGTLAAGVAHEINNPLAAVVTGVELSLREVKRLDGKGDLRELEECLRDTREASERIRMIVRDLKIFSRSEEDARAPLDVHRILESVTRMAWNEIRHRARLVKAFGPVRAVYANESRLSQVFLNLVVNAAQAIPEGNADRNEIRISTRMSDDAHVAVDIKDSGSGIPLEVQPRLFTPFFTTKPAGSGTGLGLAICQRILAAVGGTITFTSELGVGTCFTVHLPVAANEALELGPQPRIDARRAQRRGRVLVIDDDPMVTQSLRRVLSREHEVVCVEKAARALEILRAGEVFDVILCDLMMPDVNGMEFFAAIEATDPVHAARLVFMTGGAFTPQARAFLDARSNHRFEKPFDIQGLRALVNGLIR